MLENKVAVIIGADNKIGSAIARRFAYEGAYLILTSEDLSALQNLDNEIKNLGGEAMLAQLDMLDFEQVNALYSTIENKFQRLDILITSNLYIGKPNMIVDYKIEEIQKIINLNFYINWYLIKCFDPLFKLSESARLIFTTVETLNKKENLYFSPYFSIQSALQNLVENYTKQNLHSKIKANIISVENYDEQNEIAVSKYFTDIFTRLSSDKCSISGRKHYIQYQ
jgi:NAD(P)-dependent dehydrogenase (short-subunit alcohol dehydrogenase family)